MGICFGAQLVSKALGGKVYPGKTLEVGWHQVRAVDTIEEGAHWLKPLPSQFEAFQWHAHTFSVPPSAIPLWSAHCIQQQGFIKGNILAMQFHLEFTAEVILELSRKYASDLIEPSECVQTDKQMTENLDTRIERLHQVADLFYNQWLTISNLKNKLG